MQNLLLYLMWRLPPKTPQKRTVVIIPDDVPLTASEKSILSKSLTFVAVKRKTNKYQVKTDCASSIFAAYVSKKWPL